MGCPVTGVRHVLVTVEVDPPLGFAPIFSDTSTPGLSLREIRVRAHTRPWHTTYRKVRLGRLPFATLNAVRGVTWRDD